MARKKILLVDNDPDFLETRREFLEKEGYEVIPASSPREAMDALEQGRIDLVILDIRLLNDDDEKDISGLELAKTMGRSVPVIMLTAYPAIDYVRQALEPQADGVQIAQGFIAKVDGPIVLLTTVRKVLETSKRQNISLGNMVANDSIITSPPQETSIQSAPASLIVSEQMLKDYELARQHARWVGWVRLTMMAGGGVIFLVGVLIALLGYRDIGLIGAGSGIIAGTLGKLLTPIARDANRRWEQFHKELNLFYQREKKKM